MDRPKLYMGQPFILSLTIAAVLAIGGCGTKTAWVKPGASQEDFARDSYECERDARATAGSRGAGLAGGGGLTAAIDSGEYQRRCLRLRGWVAGGDSTTDRPPGPDAAPAATPVPEPAPGAPAPNPEM